MVDISLLKSVDYNDLETLKPYAFHLCQIYLKESWTKLKIEQFILERIDGGQENYTFKCMVNDQNTFVNDFEGPSKVILRIHGNAKRTDSRRLFLDNLVSNSMSLLKLGPHVYGIFDLGRIEHYFPCLPLKQKEFNSSSYSIQIAKQIAAYHLLDFPFIKEPDVLFESLKRDLDEIYDKQDLITETDELHKQFFSFNIKNEIDDLIAFIKSLDSTIVFCHNDIFFGNTLKLSDNKVMLIDYEESSYNYRGSDLGFYFSSWMFNSCENPEHPYFCYFPNNYPSLDAQLIFINAYIDEYKKLAKEKDNKLFEKACENLTTEKLLIEARAFSMLAHLMNSIWAKGRVGVSKINFGYAEWAVKRCEAYFIVKNMFFANGLKSYRI